MLGCWCKPFRCHGDILIKLFKERKCSTRLKHFPGREPLQMPNIQLGADIGNECQEKDNFIPISPTSRRSEDVSNHTPLRLTGGVLGVKMTYYL